MVRGDVRVCDAIAIFANFLADHLRFSHYLEIDRFKKQTLKYTN